MNIETTKIELTKRILEVNDPDLLERIKSMLPEKSGDFWDELTQEQQSEIELGLQLLDEGKSVDFDAFLKSQK